MIQDRLIKEPVFCEETGRKLEGAVIECNCMNHVQLALHGHDTYCDNCEQCWNSSGQQIDFPNGQGEDYCGEREYED